LKSSRRKRSKSKRVVCLVWCLWIKPNLLMACAKLLSRLWEVVKASTSALEWQILNSTKAPIFRSILVILPLFRSWAQPLRIMLFWHPQWVARRISFHLFARRHSGRDLLALRVQANLQSQTQHREMLNLPPFRFTKWRSIIFRSSVFPFDSDRASQWVIGLLWKYINK